jgi:glycosyltransferase involved in cell wall biosynthesis
MTEKVLTVSPPNIWVVIAAWNEAAVIADVVAAVRAKSFTVVVVDDGSEDKTSDEASRAGAYVLRHPVNLGQGAALQTGVKYAVTQGAEYVITFDADGQHSEDEIQMMVETLREKKADIALGSRFIGKTVGIPKLRVLTLKAAVYFTFLTTGLKLTDAHNGFRALTRECAMRLKIHQNRMAHASEIVAFIAWNKFSYVEVPVTITYSEYSLKKGQKYQIPSVFSLSCCFGGFRDDVSSPPYRLAGVN